MANAYLFNKDKLSIPVGGIGTGFLSLSQNAKIYGLCLDERDNCTFLNDAFFAIKASDNSSEKAIVLQSDKNDYVNFPTAEKVDISTTFPFTHTKYECCDFPCDISCNAYSPFMPKDSVDSGIPCCIFDFSVTNRNNTKLDLSFYFAVSHNFDTHECNAGCSECGEAHILISDTYNNNMCISTDEKFISFGTGLKSFKDFDADLLNSSSQSSQNDGKLNIICAKFSLEKGQTKNVSFCLSWYFPDCCINGIHLKNYYTKYFESSAECAEYCFSHKERLYSQSKIFSDNIFSSCVSNDALTEVNEDLLNLRKCHMKRNENGELILSKNGFENFAGLTSFLNTPSCLYTLFPELDYSFTNFLYKKASDEYGKIDFSTITPLKNNGICEQDTIYLQLLCILKSFRYYLHTNDLTEIIENWYYITRCIDYFFCEDSPKPYDKNANGIFEKNEFQHLYSSALFSACELAKAVNDKARIKTYSELYENSTIYQSRLALTSGFALLNEASGFSYNAITKHIGFTPKSDNIDFTYGDSFKCFFATPECYGYVEEGVDYIEINILYGKLTVRSFKVPRTPRLVQYGGRNWNFKDTGLCALLDSDLEITVSKKLTILIDIK